MIPTQLVTSARRRPPSSLLPYTPTQQLAHLYQCYSNRLMLDAGVPTFPSPSRSFHIVNGSIASSNFGGVVMLAHHVSRTSPPWTTNLRPKNVILQSNFHRHFATSRQKRAAAAAAEASESSGKENAGSQSSPSSSILGKRPGQTPFSPPATQTSKNILQYTADGFNTSGSTTNIMRNKTLIGKDKMPLILPPFASQIQQDAATMDHTPNQNVDENDLRKLFLQQGIVPPSPRPIVSNNSMGFDKDQRTPVIPPPDPSGISNADPEDILDLASMYDPSIHLPDKPNFLSPSNRNKYEAGTPLTEELIAYIGVRGPITVAEMMRRVLRDGRHGYYTSKGSRSGKKGAAGVDGGESEDDVDDDNDWDLEDGDENAASFSDSDSSHIGGEHVIGSGGDFITAPEVSQLFGESLLVWFMTQYQALGNPSKIQLIEIGPGKGTLICDIIRSAIATFPDFAAALTSSNEDGKKVDVGVHLVEVANGMRARQKESLQKLEKEKILVEKECRFRFPVEDNDDEIEEPAEINEDSAAQGTNISVQWHDVLSSVPTHDAITGHPIATFIICQELVDALPVHSFQKIEGGAWRERLVDVAIRDDSEASDAANDVRAAVARRYASAESDAVPSSALSPSTPTDKNKKIPRLRFVLPPDTTPALRTLMQVNRKGFPQSQHKVAMDSLPTGAIIEACPEGLLLVQDIADRIQTCKGAALIIDYGEDGSSGGDTLRGFWKHTQVHPLSRPGEVDVTADVDFGALREAVNRRVSLEESLEKKMKMSGNIPKGDMSNLNIVAEEKEPKASRPEAFGPITQGKFLASMGVVERVERYIEDDATTDDQAYELYSAMERLMAPDQMGERYKVLAIAAKKGGIFSPPGF